MFKNATSKPKFLKKEERVPVETLEEPKVEEPVANLEVNIEKVKKPKKKCSEKQLLRLEKMRKRKAEINDMKRELRQLKEEKQSKVEVEKLEEQLKTIKDRPIVVEVKPKEVKIVEPPKSILKKEVKKDNKLATPPTVLDYDILSEKIYNRLIKSIKKPPIHAKVVKQKVVKKVVNQERRGRVAPLSRPTPAPTPRQSLKIRHNNESLFSNYLNTRRNSSRRGWV